MAEGDVEAGREVALTVCARCHVVGAEKSYGGIDSTPTFFLMSEKLDNYRQRVLTLKARRPQRRWISTRSRTTTSRTWSPTSAPWSVPDATAHRIGKLREPPGRPRRLRPGMAYARSIETMIKKYEH
ncbi:MAG TPA: hypothetical protein VE597_01565 [Geminicoccaceae bacterium]|nr:hypothetical protein [Geminicoccaceae bacterium]